MLCWLVGSISFRTCAFQKSLFALDDFLLKSLGIAYPLSRDNLQWHLHLTPHLQASKTLLNRVITFCECTSPLCSEKTYLVACKFTHVWNKLYSNALDICFFYSHFNRPITREEYVKFGRCLALKIDLMVFSMCSIEEQSYDNILCHPLKLKLFQRYS